MLSSFWQFAACTLQRGYQKEQRGGDTPSITVCCCSRVKPCVGREQMSPYLGLGMLWLRLVNLVPVYGFFFSFIFYSNGNKAHKRSINTRPRRYLTGLILPLFF